MKASKQMFLLLVVLIIFLRGVRCKPFTVEADDMVLQMAAKDGKSDRGCFPCLISKDKNKQRFEFFCKNNIYIGCEPSQPKNSKSSLLCNVTYGYVQRMFVLTSLLTNSAKKRRAQFCKDELLIECPSEKRVLLRAVGASADYTHLHLTQHFLHVEDITCNSTLSTTTAPQDVGNKQDILPRVRQRCDSSFIREIWFERHKRNKRASSRNCKVHLIADHLFYSHFGHSNIERSVREMLSAINFADNVFRSTDFDGDRSGDNIGFIVANITVIQEIESSKLEYFPFAQNAREYLNSVSKNNFEDYCLAIVFTYIDFSGVVGISYRAKINSNDVESGVCSGFQKANFDHDQRSLNTVVVSYFNIKSREKVHIALAHELGHSFGSGHDDDTDCSASYTGRQFLMHSNNIKGSDISNFRFSSCSVQQMKLVLEKQAQCLAVRLGPVCGNTLVEEGEGCDCGSPDICEFIDRCCTPAGKNISDTSTPCMPSNSRGAQCSPVSSPCCTNDCMPVPIEQRKVCRAETECYFAAYCGESGSECPVSIMKSNGTPCANGTKLCNNGVCHVSLCESRGLMNCQCQAQEKNLCKMCCKTNDSSECLPAHYFNILSPENQTLFLKPGEDCGNGKGTCNVDYACNFVGFSAAVLADYFSGAWLSRYWKQVLICFTILLILFLLFLLTKQRYSPHTNTFTLIQLNTLLINAQEEKQKCEKELEAANKLCQELVQKIQQGNIQSDYVFAVTRLHILFPSVDMGTLTNVIGISSNEEMAVRLLLNMHYPMTISRMLLLGLSAQRIKRRNGEEHASGDK